MKYLIILLVFALSPSYATSVDTQETCSDFIEHAKELEEINKLTCKSTAQKVMCMAYLKSIPIKNGYIFNIVSMHGADDPMIEGSCPEIVKLYKKATKETLLRLKKKLNK